MGFSNFLGDIVGGMAAMAEEIKSLRSEYESMTNEELVREFKDLEGKYSDDSAKRRKVVVDILKDRGVIQAN